MNGRNVSAVMTPDQMNQARAAIQTLTNLMPFLISLSDDERDSLYSMGTANVPFVQGAYHAVQTVPHIFPPTLDVTEFGRDTALYANMHELKILFESFFDKFIDTYDEVGAEGLFTSRFVYKQIKIADESGTPGLKSLLAMLAERFKGQGRKKKKETDSNS
jgi:hypothetical protein